MQPVNGTVTKAYPSAKKTDFYVEGHNDKFTMWLTDGVVSQGENVMFTFTQKVNGQYTNNNVDKGSFKLGSGAAASTAVPSQAPSRAAPVAAPKGPTKKDYSIVGQSVFKCVPLMMANHLTAVIELHRSGDKSATKTLKVYADLDACADLTWGQIERFVDPLVKGEVSAELPKFDEDVSQAAAENAFDDTIPF